MKPFLPIAAYDSDMIVYSESTHSSFCENWARNFARLGGKRMIEWHQAYHVRWQDTLRTNILGTDVVRLPFLDKQIVYLTYMFSAKQMKRLRGCSQDALTLASAPAARPRSKPKHAQAKILHKFVWRTRCSSSRNLLDSARPFSYNVGRGDLGKRRVRSGKIELSHLGRLSICFGRSVGAGSAASVRSPVHPYLPCIRTICCALWNTKTFTIHSA